MLALTRKTFLYFLLTLSFLVVVNEAALAGYIGVELYEQDVKKPPYKGIQVIYVFKNAPADHAGIMPGDVILSFDNTNYTTSKELVSRLKALSVGRPVHVRIWRKGETREIVLIMGDYTRQARRYQHARKLAVQRKLQESLRIALELTSNDPEATGPRFLRAWIYFQLKQYQPIIKDMSHILARHRISTAYSYRADAYRLLKQYAMAIKDYNEAIRMKPRVPEYYNRRGICYEEMGDLDRALHEYNRALEVNPDFAYGYKNRADIFRKRGNIAKAKLEYEIAAKLFVKEGVDYKKKKMVLTAIQRYTTAISLNTPYSPSAYYNRGLAYEATNKYQRAVKDYTKAIELSSSSAAYLRRGFVYAQILKDYDRAEADWRKVLRLDPRGKNGQLARKNLKALEKIRPSNNNNDDDEW